MQKQKWFIIQVHHEQGDEQEEDVPFIRGSMELKRVGKICFTVLTRNQRPTKKLRQIFITYCYKALACFDK